MKVAVCLTKKGGEKACRGFAEGIIKSGDKAKVFGANLSAIETIRTNYDVVVKACDFFFDNISNIESRRTQFRKALAEMDKETIIIESAAFNDRKNCAVNDKKFYSVGINGIKTEANYNNKNSPSDRWNKIGCDIKPWRTDGDYVLYIMQNLGGLGLKNLDYYPDNPLAYFHDHINQLDKSTDRPVRIRLHPNQTAERSYSDESKQKRWDNKRKQYMKMFSGLQSIIITGDHINILEKDMSEAWCAVGNTSNALCECVINGIPIITNDKFCMAYDMAEHDIGNLENPRTPNRTQWCHDLAYPQWTIKEMKNGDPWRHLKSELKI